MEQLALFGPSTAGTCVCPSCGAVSPNEYLHSINHGGLQGSRYCITQWCVINHIVSLRRNPDAYDADYVASEYARSAELGLVEADFVLA